MADSKQSISRLNVTSFNCCGYKSSREYIFSDIIDTFDIIALQETWLMPHEVGLPDALSEKYNAFSISSVNVNDGILRGRPYGGLAFMWHEKLNSFVRVKEFNDDRLLGLTCTLNGMTVLFLNVYLPTDAHNNYDEFMFYLGKIISIVNESEVDAVCVVGDFNANPNSPYFQELQHVCDDNDLVITDVAVLPADTYTHINNNGSSCRWLDHVVLSKNINHLFSECYVKYGGATSDHFPICFSLCNVNNIEINSSDVIEKQIAWDFNDDNKKVMFQELLSHRLASIDICVPVCNGVGCIVYDDHCAAIDNFYERLRGIILEVAVDIFGFRSRKDHAIPGWNMYVSELHNIARRDFLYWRSIGSPREGPDALNMRRSRARFKLALRECKREEERMRAEAIAAKLVVGNSSDFWKELKKICPQKRTLAGRVDDAEGEQQIANLWKGHFQRLLNSVNNDAFKDNVLRKCSNSTMPEAITVGELKEIVKSLPGNKAIGEDSVPAEVYKFSPHRLLVLLSILLTTCFRHQYLPLLIMKVILVPLLKSKLKDPMSSDNYRPIAIATALSKIIELIILKRIEDFLIIANNQFEFRKNHSTDMCIFMLKDILNYYNSLNSPIFMCFLDIKKAFDKVNHFNLFMKLLNRGVPPYIVKLLHFWYRNQLFQVK